MKSIEEKMAILERGVVNITEREELKAKLAKGKPLIVKLGVDPTAADLHLGFTVVLRKLRQFQDMGHQAVLLIGSFTAQVGDPTGRDKTRPQITEEQVLKNAEHYLEQASRVVDKDKLIIRYNGEWFSKMTFKEVIALLSKATLARTLERDDFQKRFQSNLPIHMHEFVYPLMQGYDSVVLKADVELGGNDQTFNLMVGRDLQREEGMEPQVCITMPLLEGLDGVRKMSKSYGNYVAIADPPNEKVGKLMSVNDELMFKYLELLTDVPMEQIAEWRKGVKDGTVHPMTVKKAMAHAITEIYDGKEAADAAIANFEQVFSKKELPEDIPEYKLKEGGIPELDLLELMVETKLAPTKSEARRIIQQGGVTCDGEKVTGFNLTMPKADSFILKVGKRKYLKVIR